MKSNLVVLCVENNFRKKVSKTLADNLEMSFVDVEDIINYELYDAQNIIEKAGIEYFNKLKNKIINQLFTFENSVIALNVQLLAEIPNVEKIKKSATFICLDMDKTLFSNMQKNKVNPTNSLKKINMISFQDRQNYCKKYSDINVKINNNKIKDAVNNILNELKKLFV